MDQIIQGYIKGNSFCQMQIPLYMGNYFNCKTTLHIFACVFSFLFLSLFWPLLHQQHRWKIIIVRTDAIFVIRPLLVLRQIPVVHQCSPIRLPFQEKTKFLNNRKVFNLESFTKINSLALSRRWGFYSFLFYKN